MRHLIKGLAALVAVLTVVGGTVAAPAKSDAPAEDTQIGQTTVAVPPDQKLDNLLQGQAAPEWSPLVTAAYFNPVPGLGTSCHHIPCSDDSICDLNSCGPCGSEGSESIFPRKHCS